MKKITKIFLLLLLASCSLKNEKSKLRINSSSPQKTLSSAQLDSVPNAKFLDSICDENSSIVYDWTEESLKSEKSAVNSYDLDIKINRKVELEYKNTNYTLFPFFRRSYPSSTGILMLHILIVKKESVKEKLKKLSFTQLSLIAKDKSYYYY